MNIERKLASIVRIADIQPIPGADAIEVATVKGWKVVVKKNEYKIDDMAVYYEIDSFLPIKPEFEFLRKSSYKRMSNGDEGFRLKTIKLRGQISQGLLTKVPEGILNPKVGDDLTEALDIIKYEPPIPAQLAGLVKGLFPTFIPKTDEIRIQNFESDTGVKLDEIGNQKVYITEKLDGTSFTVYFREGEFGVCSRNLELKETRENAHWIAATKMNLREKMSNYGKNIAIQGELIGPGIQGNPYRLKDTKVYFFTAYDIDKRRRMAFDELEWILFKFDLNVVPVLEYPYSLPTENLIDNMLAYADGKSVLCDTTDREGVVIRGLEREFSFKAISNNFLLNND